MNCCSASNNICEYSSAILRMIANENPNLKDVLVKKHIGDSNNNL